MRAVKKDWIYSEEFCKVLNMGYKREKLMMTSDFWFNNQKNQVAICWDEEDLRSWKDMEGEGGLWGQGECVMKKGISCFV